MVQAAFGRKGEESTAAQLNLAPSIGTNRILAELPIEPVRELLESAALMRFEKGERLDSVTGRGKVVFPLSGIYGGVLETEDGEAIQPVFVGSEGVIGGMRAIHERPYFLTFKARLAGHAAVIPASVVRRIAAREPLLRVALAKATDRSYRLASLHAGCARFHSLPTRCCGWLSLVHRKTGNDVVPITHEELAEVVGATRPAVSAALSDLTRSGLIRSIRRGAILLVDPDKVIATACDCWSTDVDAEHWKRNRLSSV